MKNNPYVGPRSIGGVDHENEKIYGRDREIGDLMDLLIADRIVLLYSPSGAGKTSLLQAGLVPRLVKRGFHVRPMARVNAEPPAEVNFDPANGNRYALSALLSLEEPLPKEKKTSPVDLARMTLADYLGTDANGEVLIFDQFEEILTVEPLDIAEKREFFTMLGDALRNRGRWAIFAMREDYLAGLDAYVDLVPTRFSNTLRLGLLTAQSALDCVRMPALEQKVEFTDDAAAELVKNLSRIRVQYEDGRKNDEDGGTPGLYVEPVQLQVVCRRIWDKLDEGTNPITGEHIGGVSTVDEALGAYYEDVVRAASKESGVPERTIRNWFGRSLITRQKTRSQVSRSDDATAPVVAALKPLVDSYLIRSDRRLGALWYELAHDRLVGPVLANNAKNTPELQRRAELWERGRNDALLLSSKDLRLLAPAKESAATDLEREFVDKSRRQLRARWVVGLLAAGLVIGMLGAIVLLLQNYQTGKQLREKDEALGKKDAELIAKGDVLKKKGEDLAKEIQAHEEADQRARDSQTSEQKTARLAASASLSRMAMVRSGGRVDLAALLAVEAWQQEPSPEAKYTLLGILQSNPGTSAMLHHDTQVNTIVWAPSVNTPLLLATGCSDGSIWLWKDFRTNIRIAAHSGAVLSLAFNKDGLLVSGGADGEVKLWDSKSQQQLPGPLHAHKGRVNALAFDEGGGVLVSGGEDRVIRFWTAQERRLTPAGPQSGVPPTIAAGAEVKTLGIRLADREVVGATAGGAARLWTLDPLNINAASWLASENSDAAGIAPPLSTGGGARKFVVVGSKSLLIWTGKGASRRTTIGNFESGWGLTADLSTDGLVATAGESRRIQIYRLDGKQAAELHGPENAVKQVAFSRTGPPRLASLSENDRSVWIWALAEDRNPGQYLFLADGDPLQNFSMDPSGRSFVTSLDQGGRRVASFVLGSRGAWTRGKTVDLGIRTFTDWRQDGRPLLAYSPRPERPFVVVGEPDGRTTIRTPNTLEVLATIPSPDHNRRAGVALNHDGTLLAVSGWKPYTKLRFYSLADLRHPQLLSEQPGPESPLEAIAFHPKRNLLAAGGNSMMGESIVPENREVRLWDVEDPRRPRVIAILPKADAHRLIFSHDGMTLATAGPAIALWDVPEGPAPAKPRALLPRAVLGQTTGWPRHIRFSPDDRLFVTAESDSTSSRPGNRIHLWDPVRSVRFGEPLLFPTDFSVDVADFEPDGGALILWTNYGLLRLPLDPKRWIDTLCGRANRNLSQPEWDLYVGNGKYHRTCPVFPDGEGVKPAASAQ